ncbi:hypothetical protein LCGC14_0463580 [marine sediment metagenome]|uniref:Uncharacterized protein n=1 Tax=marine sediment metagenome TaxID=412755 RepID=A0A0F9SE82_9ZZZZ
MKTKCARCGKGVKYNGTKWGIHKKCETKREKEVTTKLNQRLSTVPMKS